MLESLVAFVFSLYGIVVLATIGVLVASAWYAMRGLRDISVARRISKVTGVRAQAALDLALLRQPTTSTLETTLATMLPSLKGTQRRLRRAGIDISTRTYVLGLLAAAGLLSLLLPLPRIPSAGQPIVYLMGLHFAIHSVGLGILIQRRRQTIFRQLPEALDFVVRGLSAGQAIDGALNMAIDSVDAPLKTELSVIPRLLDLGVPFTDALNIVAAELDISEFDFFVSACNVQLESGGNLAAVLRSLSDTIRSRQALKNKVAAMSAEGKMSAAILSLLPIAILVGLTFYMPSHVAPLYDTELGQVMLVAILFWIALGAYLAFRLTKLRI